MALGVTQKCISRDALQFKPGQVSTFTNAEFLPLEAKLMPPSMQDTKSGKKMTSMVVSFLESQ